MLEEVVPLPTMCPHLLLLLYSRRNGNIREVSRAFMKRPSDHVILRLRGEWSTSSNGKERPEEYSEIFLPVFSGIRIDVDGA